MNYIQIDKLIVDGNIRDDFGDLTELTASIKEQGVRTPIQLNVQNILIDGFRRLAAAKAAGLTEIPYFVNNEVDKTTSQILAGIFQKNLNPVEEGKAYKKYMLEEKISRESLAKRISKTVEYIDKRLILVNLPKDVQEALIKKKILLGHALLLAKLEKSNATQYLRKIIRGDKGVTEAKEDLQYGEYAHDLSRVKFDKLECKHCKFNGSEQAELFETGTILNKKCLNPKCFYKKVTEFVKEIRERFKDILFKGESDHDYPDRAKYVDGESEYTCNEKGITDEYKKQCRKSKDYLVKVNDDGEVTEYFKIPSKKASGEKGEIKSEVKQKEEVRQDKLLSRVNEFKQEFLIKKSIELMVPGTKEAKVLTLIKLIRDANYDALDKGFNKIINNKDVKKLYKEKEETIDRAIAYLSRRAFRRVDLKELIIVSRNFKVNVKKHFEITKEYLEIYTKDQLGELLKELNLPDTEKPGLKKGELIQHILNQNLKGKVPRIII